MSTHTFARLALALLLTAAFGMRLVTPALAAAPVNDDIANAIELGFPDSAATSTFEATQGPEDVGCGYGPSVWYRFTGFGGNMQVNTLGSDFDTVLSVLTGPADALGLLACNDDFYGVASSVDFYAESGVTYYFMVNGYGGSSGNAVITTQEAPPPPDPFSFELEIDTTTVNAKTGQVTLGGTVTCSTDGWVSVYLTTTQRAGRALLHGSGGNVTVNCDETGPARWSLQDAAWDGIFKGGNASVAGAAYGEGLAFQSGSWYIEIFPTDVRLTGSR